MTIRDINIISFCGNNLINLEFIVLKLLLQCAMMPGADVEIPHCNIRRRVTDAVKIGLHFTVTSHRSCAVYHLLLPISINCTISLLLYRYVSLMFFHLNVFLDHPSHFVVDACDVQGAAKNIFVS